MQGKKIKMLCVKLIAAGQRSQVHTVFALHHLISWSDSWNISHINVHLNDTACREVSDTLFQGQSRRSKVTSICLSFTGRFDFLIPWNPPAVQLIIFHSHAHPNEKPSEWMFQTPCFKVTHTVLVSTPYLFSHWSNSENILHTCSPH